MNELKVFANPEFGQVRTVEIGGEPWLVGKDVALALGYSNHKKALADHVDPEDKGVTKCYSLGGPQNMTVINESGLYSLVLGSKLPTARKFRRWVTAEVLPAIRGTGRYEGRPMTPAQLIAAQAQVLVEMEGRMEAVEAKADAALKAAGDPWGDPWRSRMMERVTEKCRERGLSAPAELGRLYRKLEVETGCVLTARVTNLRARKRKAGMKRKEALTLGKMDAISADRGLRAPFEALVESW